MTSRHWIRASGASKPFGGSVIVWDIESWGLYASKFAFGCTLNINTGEERIFYNAQDDSRY